MLSATMRVQKSIWPPVCALADSNERLNPDRQAPCQQAKAKLCWRYHCRYGLIDTLKSRSSMSTTGGSTDCACAAAAIDGLCPGKAEWQQTIDKSNLQAPPLTKQDAAFEKEGCQFVWGLNELTVEDLNSLFKKARNQVACHIATLRMSAPADAHLAEHANVLLGPSLCHSLSPVIKLWYGRLGFPKGTQPD